MMRFVLAQLVLLPVLGLASACASSATGEAASSRSVVLVTIDALRADRLPPYGSTETLPAFQRMARQSVVFEDAATVAPMARPAAATLLTGIAPDRLGVRDDISDRLPQEARPLAVAAREAKARTGAFVSTPFCSYASGFDRGFDLFDGPEETAVGPIAFEPPQRPAAEVVGHAATWIGSLPAGTPFLAWVHLGTLHGRAVGVDDASADAGYAEGLLEVDGALSKLMDALAPRADVDLVVVGTHGTHLGEERRRGAAFWLSRETLRVPLYWRGAGLEPRREGRPVWAPDVPVAAAARAGWSLPETEGTDLLAAGPGTRERRAWTWAPDDQIAWPNASAVERGGRWEPDDARPAAPRPREMPEATRAALAAAGVVLGTPQGERKPKDEATRTDVLVRLQRVRGHIAANRPLPSMKQGRRLQEEHPENLGVLLPWVYMAAVGNAKERSEPAAKTLLARFPDRGEALHWAAHVWYEDRRKAEALLQGAWDLGPREPEIQYDLACLRALQGDTPGAIARLRQAIDLGYRDWRHLEADLDLVSVRKAPEYAELLRARGR